MSQPRQKDPSDPLYDPNDKYNEYKVNFHANESHSEDEFDSDDGIPLLGSPRRNLEEQTIPIQS